MKATIDIPEELYRRVKARTAMEGTTVREVTTELYRRWLEEGPAGSGPEPKPEPAADDPADDPEGSWLSGWEKLGRRIAEEAADERTTRQILLDDRR